MERRYWATKPDSDRRFSGVYNQHADSREGYAREPYRSDYEYDRVGEEVYRTAHLVSNERENRAKDIDTMRQDINKHQMGERDVISAPDMYESSLRKGIELYDPQLRGIESYEGGSFGKGVQHEERSGSRTSPHGRDLKGEGFSYDRDLRPSTDPFNRSTTRETSADERYSRAKMETGRRDMQGRGMNRDDRVRESKINSKDATYLAAHPKDERKVRDQIQQKDSYGYGEPSSKKSRPEPSAAESYSSTADGTDQVGRNPCNTVLLRGLDGLTDEKRILNALAKITSLEPSKCYVMRNLMTNVSQGFGFMEFDSVVNAKKIVDYFNIEEPFEVDGKLILVDFAKNTLRTTMAGIDLAKRQFHLPPKEQNLKSENHGEGLHYKEVYVKQQKASLTFGPGKDSQLNDEERELLRAQQLAQEELKRGKMKVLEANNKDRAANADEKQVESGVGVDPDSGYEYDINTGLYFDRGKCIPEKYIFVGHSMSNSLDLRIFDSCEIVPNGRLEELVTTAVKLRDTNSLKNKVVCCHLFFGITDLLDVKQGDGYREVILREKGDLLLISKLNWAFTTLTGRKVVPVFCTFPPMNFEKHNQTLLKTGITGVLKYETKYGGMQARLNDMVTAVNAKINEFNCQAGMVTCQLAAKLFYNEKGKCMFKDAYLKDGLHLTVPGATLMNLELAQNLRKAKQGKRSLEWLKKANQIKTSGFSIKKNEEAKPIIGHSPGQKEQRAGPEKGRANIQHKDSRNDVKQSVKSSEKFNAYSSNGGKRGSAKAYHKSRDRFTGYQSERSNSYDKPSRGDLGGRSGTSIRGGVEHASTHAGNDYYFNDRSTPTQRNNQFQGNSLPKSLLGDRPLSLLGNGPPMHDEGTLSSKSLDLSSSSSYQQQSRFTLVQKSPVVTSSQLLGNASGNKNRFNDHFGNNSQQWNRTHMSTWSRPSRRY